ncbi:MAG: GNAT family N-acetyltransferase [Bulleidia sp.]
MKSEQREWIDRKGRTVIFRSAEKKDANDLIAYMKQTAAESDFLLREIDEIRLDEAMECRFIEANLTSSRDVMIVAIVDGKTVGCCSVSQKGMLSRIRHRCELACALIDEYQGAGIGTKMMEMMETAAKTMGYEQMELEVVETNTKAITMYEKCGFVRTGTMPDAFRYRNGTYAGLISMMKKVNGSD